MKATISLVNSLNYSMSTNHRYYTTSSDSLKRWAAKTEKAANVAHLKHSYNHFFSYLHHLSACFSLSVCVTANIAISPGPFHSSLRQGSINSKTAGKNILLKTHCSSGSIFYSLPLETSHKMKMKYESDQYQSVFFSVSWRVITIGTLRGKCDFYYRGNIL